MIDTNQYIGIGKSLAESQINSAKSDVNDTESQANNMIDSTITSQINPYLEQAVVWNERIALIAEAIDDAMDSSTVGDDIENIANNIEIAINNIKFPTIPDIPKIPSFLLDIPKIQIEFPTPIDIYEYVNRKIKERKQAIQNSVLNTQKLAAERERKTFIPEVKNQANSIINSTINRVITQKIR